jgi:lipopolysaccharide transport system ATP-binding protein
MAATLAAPWRRLRELGGHGDKAQDFWALRDVSFDVQRGEVIGVIGRNGAGKSTLLKILSRITAPTSGRAILHGRLGSLLEVGTGFHKELTGRENVYLNGAILGMSKTEIDRRFDEIVAFAEIEQFLDTPVKRYSSGMYVRLAFAVAAHLEPEILLVDEVLAVGDVSFQNKCLGKMDAVRRAGRTILFVSHNMAAVKRLCGRVMQLQGGQIVEFGPSQTVIENYLKAAEGDEADRAEVHFDARPAADMVIRVIRILDEQGAASNNVEHDGPITVDIAFDVNRPVRSHRVACAVYTTDGTCVMGTSDADCHAERMETRRPGHYRTRFVVPACLLNAGRYVLNVGAGPYGGAFCDFHERAIAFVVHDTSTRKHTWIRHQRQGVLGLELPWRQELIYPARAMSA